VYAVKIACSVNLAKAASLENSPAMNWDLTDLGQFTSQEREDAKTLRRMLQYHGKVEIARIAGTLYIAFVGAERWAISFEMFPSIWDGESFTLEEIIGGKKDETN
jgi:hypothetical protein